MPSTVGQGRKKTRQKLSKSLRDKGKISIRAYLQKFNNDDKVQLIAEPAIQKGFYHARFYGKFGKITGKQGTNYYVEIIDISKPKKILVHPVHLRKI